MTRTPLFVLAFVCSSISCTTVPATLASVHTDPLPASAAARPGAPARPRAPEPSLHDRLRPLDATAIFDGEVELLVPTNLRALHKFGSWDVSFEFEQSQPKTKHQHKIPGAWEGQLSRWNRKDPSVDVQPRAQLAYALAHRPAWSLAPAGCDDARNQAVDEPERQRPRRSTKRRDRGRATRSPPPAARPSRPAPSPTNASLPRRTRTTRAAAPLAPTSMPSKT